MSTTLYGINEYRGWIGFDLDGCIARYDGWKGREHIGEPIPHMIELVKTYLDEGYEVRIFTARAIDPEAIPYVQEWTLKHIGQTLRVTNQKDYDLYMFYDDRAVAVEYNTGNLKSFDIQPHTH
jgi:hypothetical protein